MEINKNAGMCNDCGKSNSDCNCSGCGNGACGHMWHGKSGLMNIGVLVGVLLAVYLIALSWGQFKSNKYVGSGVMPQSVISVMGKSEVMVKPDIATFTYSVQERASTVQVASDMATSKANKVLEALKKEGVAEADIKQTSYNINPVYEYTRVACPISNVQLGLAQSNYPCEGGKQIITGYEVSSSVEVKVRDLTKAGKLFQTVGTLGVQNVYGLAFSVDKIEEVRAEARAKAVADAQKQAKKLAKDLGVNIVRIVSFYDNSGNSYDYYGRGGMMMEKSISPAVANAPIPEIPAGEQKVMGSVSIGYEIK